MRVYNYKRDSRLANTQKKNRLLISSFTDEQMDRYETFRRANVNRGGVKKLANAVLNQSIANTVAVAISGFSKVFLGEVIERGEFIPYYIILRSILC